MHDFTKHFSANPKLPLLNTGQVLHFFFVSNEIVHNIDLSFSLRYCTRIFCTNHAPLKEDKL